MCSHISKVYLICCALESLGVEMLHKIMLIRDMALFFFFPPNGAFECKWVKELSEGGRLHLVISETG